MEHRFSCIFILGLVISSGKSNGLDASDLTSGNKFTFLHRYLGAHKNLLCIQNYLKGLSDVSSPYSRYSGVTKWLATDPIAWGD